MMECVHCEAIRTTYSEMGMAGLKCGWPLSQAVNFNFQLSQFTYISHSLIIYTQLRRIVRSSCPSIRVFSHHGNPKVQLQITHHPAHK
jgi:hypothetical protein